jgi:hypothetical protein
MRTFHKLWCQFSFWPKNVAAQHLKHITFENMCHACVTVLEPLVGCKQTTWGNHNFINTLLHAQ